MARFRLARGQLKRFRHLFNAAAREMVVAKQPEAPELVVDAELAAECLTSKLLEELNDLSPFGEGNPAPILGCREVSVIGDVRILEGTKTVAFEIASGMGPLHVLGFGRADEAPAIAELARKGLLSLAFTVTRDGRHNAQELVLAAFGKSGRIEEAAAV